jgi:hypothetical protein
VSFGSVAAAAILSAATLAACASLGQPPGSKPGDLTTVEPLPPAADFPSSTLYVARRRWHIDVGFAAPALREPLAEVSSSLPGAKYVFFGFGDRHYLLSRKRGPPVLLAALWPGSALILATAIEDSPARSFGADEVVALPITAEQSREVQAFIARSIERPAGGGRLVPLAEGPYEGSIYFAAIPRYSGFHTCITWAAEALRAAGFPVRSRLTLIAGQLWRQVQKLKASITGRRIAVLADHGGPAALGNHDRRLGGRRRTAAADATGQ